MPTLKYWDATQNAYVPIPGMASPANMVSTVLNTPTVASSPYTITHNLSTTNVMVQAWDLVTNDLIGVRMHIADTNHIQVFFEQNCPNNVNVLVTGAAGSLAPAPVVAARMMMNGTSQALTANTAATLTYDGTEYDSHGGCNQAAGTYTVPAGQPGDYLVTGSVATLNLAASQYFNILIQKNAATYVVGVQPQTVNATSGLTTQVSTVVRCVAGDVLRLQAIAGGACNLYIGTGSQWMTVHRIFPGLQAAGAFVPPQIPPPSGFNSFIDPSGEVWVSRNGGVWKKARDALHCRVYRGAAWTIGTTSANITFDNAVRDDYGIWNGGVGLVAPIAGWYAVYLDVSATIGSAFLLTLQAYRAAGATRVGYATTGTWAAAGGWVGCVYQALHSLSAGETVQFNAGSSVAATTGGTGQDLCNAGLSYLGSG